MRLATMLTLSALTCLLATPTFADPAAATEPAMGAEAKAEAIMFVTVSVTDYEAALEWYTEVLGMVKFMDEPIDEGVRWITVAVPGKDWPQIGLWKVAEAPELRENSQSILIQTFDCAALSAKIVEHGGTLIQEPTSQYWAVEAIVTDPWGNLLVLNQFTDEVLADE